ncbi:hypothetical protein B0H65DRAFT_543450 [Neurospora tetraspora]|uniref:Mid2 domain-containing protein n=1 Tax=Neurospora tetraspora TaxID=94610 RepID=A0AAE0MVV5_9PEZI|nr:hypothetical protein B0H65DRAFT_543450 [Neurospora tetraspora]
MASRKSPLSLFSALLLACATLPQYAAAAPYPQPEPQANVVWYTSVWTDTLTQTHTSVWSTVVGAMATNGPDCVPNTSLGESACGSICCAASQKCQYAGQCMERGPNDGAPFLGSTLAGHTYTTQYSAPYRPTSGATGTAASATASSTGGAAGGAAGGGTADTGLSGGAIAGIVIGTLAGVVLLLLLCACCIVRGLWHGFLAIFGIGAGNKRTRETVVEEERYARHSGRRDSHGSWYEGAAGGRPSGAAARKESSGKGLMGAGAALGTLWLLLGMKKDKKKESSRRKSRSENSSYYYSDYTSSGSPSSFSSDRRTRRSARSASAHGAGRTRTASRVTRTTTRVSRVSSVPPPPPGQRRIPSRSPGPMRG